MSQIAIDDTILPTLRGNGVVNVETDDSVYTVEQEVKDPDVEVVVQLALEGLVAPVLLFTVDGPPSLMLPVLISTTFFELYLIFFL